MRPIILAALLTSTALAGTAYAQNSSTAVPNPAVPGIAHGSGPAPDPAASPTTHALPSGDVQARAAISQCDRLSALIGQSGAAAGITREQVDVWKRTSNAQLCRGALERLDLIAEVGSTGAGIRPVELPPPGDEPGIPDSAGTAATPPLPSPGAPLTGAGPLAGVPPQSPARPSAQSGASTADPSVPQPTAGMQPPAPVSPQVLVQQAQPEVTVRQQQPEVIVRMPPPLITVQQPQPEIIVRMPKPDVNVSTSQPNVRVVMPQPKIEVMPPRQAQAEPDIRLDGHPTVRVERTGEPKVIYRQAEGQPQVRFEPMDGRAAADAAPQRAPEASAVPPAPRSEPRETGALPGRTLQVDAVRLNQMPVYSKDGDRIADVKRVVAGPGDRVFLVISFGGFLGLGEREALLPVDAVALIGDRLVAENLTESQTEQLPAFTQGAEYRDVQAGRTAPVRTLE
jgi:hypothetical protein